MYYTFERLDGLAEKGTYMKHQIESNPPKLDRLVPARLG